MASLTIAGYVGEGNRRSVYRTLKGLGDRGLVLRSTDPILMDIARLVVKEGGKSLASLPEETELGADELVWVFGEMDCPNAHSRLKRFRQSGLKCFHLVI